MPSHTRYWDKLACLGTTARGARFGLIYDAKGPQGFRIYRLVGTGINDLRGYDY